ncbi:hypothetical protein JD276_13785 [Leucobacter sp. CSA1]|uniref:HTH luxR-type domain-containing protein n=1 Tax=Leucobacter chromiisoli TaxID=2796471 RepID=A0A934Q9P4_9MICO|nr:LuxR C-terminal-related transcriptional regulator [Leucobacter chromiisoli]MBK0420103.1 hypothetical protein [Leucobacter chromiisoli]
MSSRFDGAEPIIVARAPAGYGKTVAMAQWASTTATSGVWVRIRDREMESAEFVELLADEMRAAGLLEDGNPLRLASEAMAGGADPWQLLRRGLRGVPGPLALAVDGIDGLRRSTQLALVDAVRDLSTLELRATARKRTVLDEPALALDMELATLEAPDLALTAEEAARIMAVDPHSDLVNEVMAHGGAPLFAKLLATSLGEAAQPALSGRTLPDLVDSFIRLQLESSPVDEPFLRFVTATSIAEAMDPDLAARLLRIATRRPAGEAKADASEERASARALLDRAEAEGLGLWSPDATGAATFTYTPLIREAFERRLRAEQPREVPELVGAVARWELRAGHPFSALRQAVEFHDWTFASRVVRMHWNDLLRNHGPQLRELFRGTPLSVLRTHPFLTMLLALEYNRTGRSRLRALEYFALARYAARKQRASASRADRAVLRAIETASLRVSGRFDAALGPAVEGYETLLAMSPSDRDDLGRTEPTLLNQYGTTFVYAGLDEEALAAFSRSTAVGEARGLTGGLQGLALSAGTLAIAGDGPEARALLEQASRLEWPDGWLTGYMGSFIPLAEAMLALEAFDADAAERHLRSLDPHRETIEHWPLLAHADALVSLLRGEVDQARFRLQAEITSQNRRRAVAPETLARLGRTSSLIELAAGNPHAAEKALGKRQSAGGAVGRARISLVRDRPEEALRLLLAAERHPARARPSSRRIAEDLALRAGAMALLGNEERAVTATRAAFEFLRERRQGMALAMVPPKALDAVFSLVERAGLAVHDAHLSRGRVPGIIASTRPKSAFTPRELALIETLPRTRTNTELAQALSISLNTVKTQLRGLYRKLGVGTRAEALAALAAMGFTSADPDDIPARLEEPFE